MKKSLSLLSLMVALAAGAAGATGTTAGTTISNTAQISFADDAGVAQPTVNSNTVTTTVLPNPSFTITPNQTTAGTTPTQAADYANPGQSLTNIKPGDTVSFQYTLTNTGNVNGESYALTTPSVGGTGTGLTTANVKYYPASADTSGDGVLSAAEVAASTPITTISGVAQDTSVKFYQVYVVPTTATNGQTYGSSPTGTRQANGTAGTTNEPAAPFTQPTDSNNANLVTISRTDAGVIGPKGYAAGNAPAGTTDTTTTTGITIAELNDTSTAPATSTTTKVTFTNTITNTGNRTDTFDITAASLNLPAGATVRILDASGAVLTDTDSDGTVDTGTIAAGASKDIRIEVTFPAGSTTTDNTKQPTVTVTAKSANDATKTDTTTDTVLLPGVAYGDKTATGPDATQTPTQTAPTPAGNNPGGSTSVTLTSVPMQIKNTGGAAEAFTPAGSVTFSTPTGSVTVPVTYLPDANCDGTADSTTAITATPSVAPGATYCLIPVVSIPNNAYPGAYPVTQSVTGNTTGVTANDTNDTITIPKVGTPTNYVVKAVDLASAKPGDTVTYSITGQDTGNANIKAAIVSDTLPTNTSFVSISATTAIAAPAKILYRVGGTGAWSATAPTALAAATKVEVAVDSNNDNTIDNNDILKPGQSFVVTFKVKIN